MSALETLKERGFVFQTTGESELRELLDGGCVTCYAGFDPTADSLHVGHLVVVMMLAHLQRAGHRPLAIVGGGTAMVGDPTGRTEARPVLTVEEIETNMQGVRRQLARFISFDDTPSGALMLNNADWLLPLSYLGFLREYGRYFSVNHMIKAKGYAERLEREQGLSFVEFNYSILQAFDYLTLNQRYGCLLQVGGADQWGNIIAGVDLVRRVTGAPAHAITAPLITTSTGEKMGKTAAGARWLDPARLPVFEFYQFWRNVPDADIERFLALFSFLPMDEVRRIGSLAGRTSQEINEAKEFLAVTVTALVHGPAEAERARNAARAVFTGSGGDDSALPTTTIAAARLEAGVGLLDVLVETGLMPSKKEARRKVEEHGVYLAGAVISDPRRLLTAADLDGDHLVLRVGKKTYHKVVAG
jgi:tyrosyl-tRNA synthetase